MEIRSYQLVEVSNNSQLTNIVLTTINEKLDDKEKRDFIQWLNIVKNKQNSKQSRF